MRGVDRTEVELIQLHTLAGSTICMRHHVLSSTIRIFEKPSSYFIRYQGSDTEAAAVIRSRAFEYGRTTPGPNARPVFHYYEIEQRGIESA